jgi:hypothetical protein
MSRLQRHRLKSFLRDSVWLPPLLGLVAALVLHQVPGEWTWAWA